MYHTPRTHGRLVMLLSSMHHSGAALLWTAIVVEGAIMKITCGRFSHDMRLIVSLVQWKNSRDVERQITYFGDIFNAGADRFKQKMCIVYLLWLCNVTTSLLSTNEGPLFSGVEPNSFPMSKLYTGA